MRKALILVILALFFVACDGSITGFTFVEGDERNVSSTGVNSLSIEVDGSPLNTSHNYTGNLSVLFYDEDVLIINTTFDFTTNTLNFSAITIQRGNGIASQGITGNKTYYLVNDTITHACVKNIANATLESVVGCSGENETRIPCPGNAGSFSCSSQDGVHAVSGLTNSAVIPLYLPVFVGTLAQGGTQTFTINGSGFTNATTATSSTLVITNTVVINSTHVNVSLHAPFNTTLGNTTLNLTTQGSVQQNLFTITNGPLNTSSITATADANTTGNSAMFTVSVLLAEGVLPSLNITNAYFEVKNTTTLGANVSLTVLNYTTEGATNRLYLNGSAVYLRDGYWNNSMLFIDINQTTPCNCSTNVMGTYSDLLYSGGGSAVTIAACAFSATRNSAATFNTAITGVPPVVVAINGSLPTGMNATSTNTTIIVNGTPTTTGTFVYGVNVTDAISNTLSKTCQIVVNAPTPANGGGGGGGGGGSSASAASAAAASATSGSASAGQASFAQPFARDTPIQPPVKRVSKPEVIQAAPEPEVFDTLRAEQTAPTTLVETQQTTAWLFYGLGIGALLMLMLVYYIRHHRP